MRQIFKNTKIIALLTITLIGCGKSLPLLPPGTNQADKYLFERATEEIEDRNWQDARTYFQQVVNNYPQSLLRPDAKLGIGDTYLGEDNSGSLVMAVNEYREFLSFYPTSARADYAQYKIAMTHYAQMEVPERDQTETRAALQEFNVFFDNYPNSKLTQEVRAKWKEVRDHLSESSYLVGVFYFRKEWYPGAIPRFREVLEENPDYSNIDAVYYHLAESLFQTDKPAEAIPYFNSLITGFPNSEYLEEAKNRFDLLTNSNNR
jgi:outer membrane protein assembly factor BamD